jgi:glutamine amidotransferase
VDNVRQPRVAIVDYGLGNLFSVQQVCRRVGLDPLITSERDDILEADAVFLPGVGAFGDAIQALTKLDLIGPIREVHESGRLVVGICLGMQLLMSVSYEFGKHPGLGIVSGSVVRFETDRTAVERLKVPHIGWEPIHKPVRFFSQGNGQSASKDRWEGSALAGLREGEFMYFVHSYYVVPDDDATVLSLSRYGDTDFCSSLWVKNAVGFQFHPERSGPQGLRIYQNLASIIAQSGDSRDV